MVTGSTPCETVTVESAAPAGAGTAEPPSDNASSAANGNRAKRRYGLGPPEMLEIGRRRRFGRRGPSPFLTLAGVRQPPQPDRSLSSAELGDRSPRQLHLVAVDQLVAASLPNQALRRCIQVLVLEQEEPRRFIVDQRERLGIDRLSLLRVELETRIVDQFVELWVRVRREPL